MSRHKNIGYLASAAYEEDDGEDFYATGDGYGEYGEYGEYGGEYDEAPVKVSKKKKGKSTGPLGNYEEDLGEAVEEDPEMAAAIKASM